MIERRVARVETSLAVNGHTHVVAVEPRLTLAAALRDALGLTGTRIGCDEGVCGSCTVLVDGEPVRACMMFAVQAHGMAVTTVEGLAGPDGLHPLQVAFRDHHAVQCGYCSAGFMMLALAVLLRDPDAGADELAEALGANLCRCTGYAPILKAVRAAQKEMARRSGRATDALASGAQPA